MDTDCQNTHKLVLNISHHHLTTYSNMSINYFKQTSTYRMDAF